MRDKGVLVFAGIFWFWRVRLDCWDGLVLIRHTDRFVG